jgi:ABC-type nitrate/sulfonate/bicarbonate transport system substrate-binding protein
MMRLRAGLWWTATGSSLRTTLTVSALLLPGIPPLALTGGRTTVRLVGATPTAAAATASAAAGKSLAGLEVPRRRGLIRAGIHDRVGLTELAAAVGGTATAVSVGPKIEIAFADAVAEFLAGGGRLFEGVFDRGTGGSAFQWGGVVHGPRVDSL